MHVSYWRYMNVTTKNSEVCYKCHQNSHFMGYYCNFSVEYPVGVTPLPPLEIFAYAPGYKCVVIKWHA